MRTKDLNRISVFILAIAGFTSIPPQHSSGQINEGKGSPVNDTTIQRAENIITRIETVKDKADNLVQLVDDNSDKANKIGNILDKMTKSAASNTIVKSEVRTIIKEKKVSVYKPVYRDTTMYIIEGQYVDRPIIITQACRTYGGDTFRVEQTTDKGLWNKIFRKKK